MRGELDMAIGRVESVIVARPVGTLDAGTYPHLRDTLFKCVAEQPDALLVDVSGLEMPAVHALSVFALVALRSAEWPGLPVVLVTGRDAQRRMLSVSAIRRFVNVCRTEADALATIGRPPGRRRAVVELPFGEVNSRPARRFVHRTCRHWGIPATIVESTTTIVSELVENTAKHTVSGAHVRLELRDGILTAAVTDADPRPAVLREQVPGGVRPSGLLLVAGIAKAWGCAPTMSGGKTVWATLRVAAHTRWR